MTASVAELTAGMSLGEKAALASRVRKRAARLRTTRKCPTPLDLAARFDRTMVRTPALELISQRLAETIATRDGRLVISIPPQEGKSTLLRWSILWALIDDPDRRVVFTSYAAGLARTSGRLVRALVETHGAEIGLEVSRSHADAADWELEGHRGGQFSTGRGAMTGRPADCLIIDDPLRDQKEADSAVVLAALHDWYDAVPRTRLAPGAPVVIVQTRWVERDLAGRMADEGWPVVNIPAVNDGRTPDALERESGEWLVSARGRTPADWAQTRKDVGERTWAALYMGRPAPLEGGIFKRAWFDTWRVAEPPATCQPPVVVVDPADGGRDEAGVIVAAKDQVSGRAYILDDLSGNMTIAKWARLALLTCARRNAPTLAYEKSLSQLPNRIKEAWQELHQQATAIRKAGGDQAAALKRMSRADDSGEAREQIQLSLAEIADDVDAILAMGSVGPRRVPLIPRGSKDHRMMLVAPAFETGRAVMVGSHAQAEWQLSTWQVGMDSPDRADAVVHAVAMLAGISGAASLGRSQDRVPTNSTSLRNKSSSRITRSTRR